MVSQLKKQKNYTKIWKKSRKQGFKWRKMKKENRDADLRWIHGVIVQAAWFVKASLGQNA
nr:hypothetical protein [Escherichia coli]